MFCLTNQVYLKWAGLIIGYDDIYFKRVLNTQLPVDVAKTAAVFNNYLIDWITCKLGFVFKGRSAMQAHNLIPVFEDLSVGSYT